MTSSQFDAARDRLIKEIEAEAHQTESWTGRSRYADRVMSAIARVPRHDFVRPQDESAAYLNRPLPIGHGQTISQPFIVAVMTDLLDIGPTDRVLEIGTGCGYQAAVLAEVAGAVYTLEVVETLAADACARLRELGYSNIYARTGDGHAGWPDAAPFDGIIVTAAPERIPETLVEQLAPRGRLVVPVGRTGETQMLYRCVRRDDGTLLREAKLPVAFVPMVAPGTDSRRWIM